MGGKTGMDGRNVWHLVTLFAVMAVPACGILTGVGGGGGNEDRNRIESDGVVEFLGVEGGCWSLRSGNQVYEPLNLPEGMKIEGLEVAFVGELRNDVATICQIGSIIELKEIRRTSGS